MTINKLLNYARCGVSLGAYWALTTMAFGATLTLKEALQRAEVENPQLQALREQQAGAQARVAGAASLPDPKVQLTYFGESVETRTGPQEAIYSIKQTVPWLSKLSTKASIAESRSDQVGHLYSVGRFRIRRAVATSYAEVVYLDQALASTSESLALIEDMRAIVEDQTRAGGSLNAMLRLEVETERTLDQMQQLEQMRTVRRAELASLLAVELDSLGELVGFSEELQAATDTAQLLQLLEAQNSELLAMRKATESAESAVRLSRLSRLPDFTFGLNYIQVGDPIMATKDAGRDPWNVTVAVNLPIWEGKNNAEIRAAQSDKRSIEARYRSRVLELKSDLSASLARRNDAFQRMQRYEATLIPLAEQALENSRSAYASNQISALELIDSERALLDLKLNYWRALTHVHQADAAIRALIGQL